MGTNWNLNDLYKGFDQEYQNDLKKLSDLVDSYAAFLEAGPKSDKDYVEGDIKFDEVLTVLVRGLASFASLTQSTDVSNNEALGYLSKISGIMRKLTAPSVKFSRYLATVDLDKLAKESDKVKLYLSNLKRAQKDAQHLLTEKEEVLYSKMQELASSSWGQVQQLATANLTAEVAGKEYTYSDLRALAYDYNPAIRKEAYEKELKAYESVENFVALGLTNIKREVNTMVELRGYKSALDKTLQQSRMSEKTLNAMIEAMKDYRPHFAKYLRAKAEYLGHKNGLPWYDLFAPVGELTKTYTYEEAQDLVLNAFGSYSEKLASFAKRAFDNDWIDVFPKKGKRGGAFCSNQPQIGQSRFMLNFTGSLDSVSTMAHELGHGYHGDVIKANAPLHWSYPMPLAETASIFCETIMTQYLLTQFTDPKDRLSILETGLQGDTQVIIDILSRFLFESKVFESATRPISKHEMKAWMIQAQKEAYTDGLDHDQLHPYMWLVKGHYYSAGLNYYNFPYAFGLLFGKGLYAQYLKNKEKFLKNYDDLLALTTKEDAETVAASMGIDITEKSFWLDSLEMIKKDIDEVVELFKL
ncbi:M3 family oligoendopeptidase [Acholeplasma equirhinis]|uniref:M3 family oligoendopeptidase n=1 Tax=Acholeplasma equirhinis TaxID=555393 RepID=UPI00197A70FA|nr:M3 family oligoendopeptidase [Acholeplasma equirhinis]MBN3489989.1 M3 family oligoendopeptidase [Acholeplasma equirhinis]